MLPSGLTFGELGDKTIELELLIVGAKRKLFTDKLNSVKSPLLFVESKLEVCPGLELLVIA